MQRIGRNGSEQPHEEREDERELPCREVLGAPFGKPANRGFVFNLYCRIHFLGLSVLF